MKTEAIFWVTAVVEGRDAGTGQDDWVAGVERLWWPLRARQAVETETLVYNVTMQSTINVGRTNGSEIAAWRVLWIRVL